MLARIEHRIFNPLEQVYEVRRWPYHRLVCVSTAEEAYILSEEKYAAQA